MNKTCQFILLGICLAEAILLAISGMQTDNAIKIGWEAISTAKQWQEVSDRFEKVASDWQGNAQDWQKIAQAKEDDFLVCNSMLPKDRRFR